MIVFSDLAIGRDPTPLAHRYFVLLWDFSEVTARGSVDEIAQKLNAYINTTLEVFLDRYRAELPDISIRPDARNTFRLLRGAISKTPYRLYLLIDESPNLVVRKLYIEEAARYLLPQRLDRDAMEKAIWGLTEKGELTPLLSFVEKKIFLAMSNRDHRSVMATTYGCGLMSSSPSDSTASSGARSKRRGRLRKRLIWAGHRPYTC